MDVRYPAPLEPFFSACESYEIGLAAEMKKRTIATGEQAKKYDELATSLLIAYVFMDSDHLLSYVLSRRKTRHSLHPTIYLLASKQNAFLQRAHFLLTIQCRFYQQSV